MAPVVTSAEIGRPAAEVFAYATDVAGRPRLRRCEASASRYAFPAACHFSNRIGGEDIGHVFFGATSWVHRITI